MKSTGGMKAPLKILIILIIAGLIGGAAVYFNPSLLDGEQPQATSQSTTKKSAKKKSWGSSSDDDVINVGVVLWGGYSGGQYFNGGFDASENSRFYQEYGIKVAFKEFEDPSDMIDAWKSDEIQLCWNTVDAMPTILGKTSALANYNPKYIFQCDWSRGGDAVVATRSIRKVADLKGRKVAVAEMTPSHTFLIWLLDAGGLSMKDINLVKVNSAIEAAEQFKNGLVDAAVVWSPDDQDCVESVRGAKILQNTKNATHIISDGFFVKDSYLQSHREEIKNLVTGWLIGNAEINESDAARQEAAQILADGYNSDYEFCYNAIGNVRLATLGDNKNYMGLNRSYKGVTAKDLYNKMKVIYGSLGLARDVMSWRTVSDNSIIREINLTGPEHSAERAKTFNTSKVRNNEAISNKSVSVSFATGKAALTIDGKDKIDREFCEIARVFGNAYIRIEGNTDNTGSYEVNKALSLKRAKAVAKYLVEECGISADRIITVGNGPKHAVEDGVNGSNARYRRTDFQLVAE